MSSMRNAVQRRNHRERAQLGEREKWGILEKHKDYSLRARDFNAKKARLQRLRRKAADRNPDEFYFGMHRTRMAKDGTKLGDRGNQTLGHDVVRLLKTQDAGYLRIMAQKARKDAQATRQEIHLENLVEGPETNQDRVDDDDAIMTMKRKRAATHIVYVDSKEEQKAFVPERWFDTDQQGLGRTFNRPRISPPSSSSANEVKGIFHKSNLTNAHHNEGSKIQRSEGRRPPALDRWKNRLRLLQTRQRQLELAEDQLCLQRARMTKTPPVVSGGGSNSSRQRKWKVRERKR